MHCANLVPLQIMENTTLAIADIFTSSINTLTPKSAVLSDRLGVAKYIYTMVAAVTAMV